MNIPHITVSYNGGEKRVPLGVQPSLELSDSEVNIAQGELHRVLRKIFCVEQDTPFFLHEVETGRVMSKESFREPNYCVNFPTHWYLVMDGYATNPITTNSYQYNNGPVNLLTEDLSRLGKDMSSLDLEDSGLPPLADLSTDARYQSFTLKGIGNTGCSLRYFSIQPSTRSDTPMESPSRTHSRSDSHVSSVSGDSMDALRLSTTFVGQVRMDSLSERMGVTRGFVVHMINKDSILRSTVEQMRVLVEQCGNEVTLLGLPQDSDDLQFLYSEYTKGEEGQFNTDDGLITVVDIPLILGSNSSVALTSNGISPPVGMVPFDDDHSGSQENFLSYEQFPLSSDQDKHGPDDILIMGSLSEIGTHENTKWEETSPLQNRSSTGSLHQAGRAPHDVCHNGDGLDSGAAVPNSKAIHEDIDKDWYRHNDEKLVYSSPRQHQLSHVHSSSSSITNHNQLSQDSDHNSLLKKKGRKSLEALTRIGQVEGSTEETRLPVKNVDNGKTWRSQSFTSSHGYPSSDTSQLSGGSTRGHSGTQLSGQSLEDQRMSGDSVGSGNRDSRTTSVQSVNTTPATASSSSGRRAVRGYQSRRAQLHKSKSKTTLSEFENETTQLPLAGESSPHPSVHHHLEPPHLEPPAPQRTEEASPIVRHCSVKEKATQSSLHPEKSKSRPLSAIEPRAINSSLTVPGNTPGPRPHLNFVSADSPIPVGGEVPLFTTRTTFTISGEEEVFREVNIEDAIARSQGNTLSCQEIPDDTLPDQGRKRNVFARHRSSDAGFVMSSINSPGLSNSNPARQSEIVCHGLLSIKQDMSGVGKKAQDRTWRNYYAVLVATRILFYKDKREAILEKASEEPPLEVVPATVDLETKGTKRKYAFRLMTSHGHSYILQADDAPSRQRWMEFIQQLNAKQKLVPGYLDSLRRMSSPQPMLSGSGKSGGGSTGGGGTSLFGRIKRTLTRQRDSDGPDSSSFVAFGQPLKDCPVSPDNKRVPLVVEFCVNEIEEHGLTVEGIYRKPGLIPMINSMSVQMDKGNYALDLADYGQDIHIVGSLLKKFLKDLPDPLIPGSVHDHFLACARIPDQKTRLHTLKELVFQLPTAHYHTLHFLMTHLAKVAAHSALNKMTLRNVALVFGPTLMRSSADGEEMLANMNAGYTIVELLCQHADYICSEELCAEEQAEQEKSAAEEEVANVDPPYQSRELETRAQKAQALSNASPMSVRRIRNKIPNDNKDSVIKRHSTNYSENLGSMPKLVNRSGSATLAYPESSRGHFHASDSNISTSPSPLAQGEGQAGRKKVVRHSYEDVDISQREEQEVKQNTRTINWINHHTEMNWGRGKEAREVTGSMWSSRNRVHRQPSKEKVRNGGVRRMSKTKSDQGRDSITASYQGPSPRHSYRQQPTSSAVPQAQQQLGPQANQRQELTSSVVPQAQPQLGTRWQEDRTLAQMPPLGAGPTSVAQHSQGRSRRISYMTAMNDPTEVPVRENSSTPHRTREEHFSPGSAAAYGGPGPGSYSSSTRPGNMADNFTSSSAAHLYNYPPTHHGRVNQYSSSMHRDMSTPINPALTRRKSSETSDPPVERGGRYYRSHLQGQRPHRTFSNERTYTSTNSPPQRERDHGNDSIPSRRIAKVESYL